MKELTTAQDVQEKVGELYGVKELPSPLSSWEAFPGVLHVTAVHLQDGVYKTIDVSSAEAPRSDEDFFALNLARARADVIVTSGEIVRSEKDLEHSLQGLAKQGLRKYRSEILGKPEVPYSVIYTRKVLDLDAKIFSGSTKPVVYTTTESALQLRDARAHERGILIVDGGKNTNMGDLLAYLKKDLGAQTVLLETGPSVTNPLYNADMVGELMLSVHRGEIAKSAVGGNFVSPSFIARKFSQVGERKRVGDWEFMRYRLKE